VIVHLAGAIALLREEAASAPSGDQRMMPMLRGSIRPRSGMYFAMR
jgi:hypothetical protein